MFRLVGEDVDMNDVAAFHFDLLRLIDALCRADVPDNNRRLYRSELL